MPTEESDGSAARSNGPFHGYPGDGAEFDGSAPRIKAAVTRVVVNAGKAIGAYERLLSCGNHFDAWLRATMAPFRARRSAGRVCSWARPSASRVTTGRFCQTRNSTTWGLRRRSAASIHRLGPITALPRASR